LRHKKSKGEYLAFLSVKYGVDSEKFLVALRQATDENKKVACGQFSIEFRGKTKKTRIFLIKNALGIIAQFQVSDDFLLESRDSLVEFMDTGMVRKILAKKRKISRAHFIRDIRSGMNHINLEAKILAIAEPRHVVLRYGNYTNTAMALLGDETGTIKLCLWNEEIDSVSVGDTVQIVNARASMFNGELQLTLGARGALTSAGGRGSQIAPPVLRVPASVS
jgi:replication factor A1